MRYGHSTAIDFALACQSVPMFCTYPRPTLLLMATGIHSYFAMTVAEVILRFPRSRLFRCERQTQSYVFREFWLRGTQAFVSSDFEGFFNSDCYFIYTHRCVIGSNLPVSLISTQSGDIQIPSDCKTEQLG